MGITEKKAKIHELLVAQYGSPGKILNQRSHTNVYSNTSGNFDLREIEEKFLDASSGKLSAQALKHWLLLDKTLECLRQEYGIFLQGNLYTTCPIHSYFGRSSAGPDDERYLNKFRSYIQFIGTIAFTCDSRTCTLNACPLHRSKRKGRKQFGKQRFDLVNLVQILEALKEKYAFDRVSHNREYYRKRIAEALGISTAPLKSGKGKDLKGKGFPKYKGYAVPKTKLREVLQMPTNNPELTEEFMESIRQLLRSCGRQNITSITRSPDLCYIHEKFMAILDKLGSAAKLWLYIWMLQEEARKGVKLDAKACGDALLVHRSTVLRYKKILEKKGYLKTADGRVSVGV